jgi:hypothetical protein
MAEIFGGGLLKPNSSAGSIPQKSMMPATLARQKFGQRAG